MATEQLAELVVRAQQGDAEACATLYEQYATSVYRYLRCRLSGPDETVQDLTADVFVTVFAKLDRYVDRGAPFTAWLYRVARNKLVDYTRTQNRSRLSPLEYADEVAEPRATSAYGQVLDRQILAPVLAGLKREQRQVVESRFLAGRTVAETAALTGRSEEAVKKLQARGLANLRRHLTGTGGLAERRAMLVA
jgi:RNA polymerase sigma-70 factor (ECF subfamily)